MSVDPIRPNFKGLSFGGGGMDPMTMALILGGVGKGLDFFQNNFGRPVAQVPADLRGLRRQNIDLLGALLKPGAFGAGGMGTDMFFGSAGKGLDNFLNMPSPERMTFDSVSPILQGMLTGTGPQFERDIAIGNQQGGRFSSGNAIMRGEAFRNLYNMRNNTAQTLGMLSGQAGSADFDRMFQRAQLQSQILAGLFGMGGQATLSLPISQKLG